MMGIFVNNVKILGIFIIMDLLVTVVLMATTGASFVMMNSLTFKLMAALIAVGITSAGFTYYEYKQSEDKK